MPACPRPTGYRPSGNVPSRLPTCPKIGAAPRKVSYGRRPSPEPTRAHPYQLSRAKRCADGDFPGNRSASGAELCVLSDLVQAVQASQPTPHYRSSRSRDHVSSREPAWLIPGHGGVGLRWECSAPGPQSLCQLNTVMAVEELLTTKLTTTDTTERDGGMLLLSARLLPGLVDVARKLASRLRSSLPCRGRCRPTRLGPVPGPRPRPPTALPSSIRAPGRSPPFVHQSALPGPPLNGPVTVEVIQPP
jgi:hypothetical protein